ncbi:putative ascorbate peroxidase [Watersipora subatra]|uniref:putative ascorbate peroxidase n=1 Tax=Watersipora subatra TaxID=2589382 RepID=UPI00355C3FEB
MKSKVIIAAVLAFTTLLDSYDAALTFPINCNTRGTTGQSYRLPGETTEQGRQRRLEERCYCRPTLVQCQTGFQRPETSISSIKTSLKNFIEESLPTRLPASLRLVFHSCVGSTGCDGCINGNVNNNIGLMAVYDDAIDLWMSLGQPIGFADFIVLLGTVAVETGMAQEGGPGKRTLPFRTGRKSCRNPQNYNFMHSFPQGQDTRSLEFLMTEFGLTRRLAIALMGAHSLGRCRSENSGFVGPWDRTPEVLDNNYYLSLVNADWQLGDSPNGFTQWNAGGAMMLHADMTLIRDLNIASGERPTCTSASNCPLNGADNNEVQRYTQNQTEWANDFEKAFLKMVEHR